MACNVSPAVADGCVYVGSYDNNIYCLDAATGALKWNWSPIGTQSIISAPAVAGEDPVRGERRRQHLLPICRHGCASLELLYGGVCRFFSSNSGRVCACGERERHGLLLPTLFGVALNATYITVTPSQASVNQGQVSELISNVSSGISPYTYQWFEKEPIASNYMIVTGSATGLTYDFVTDDSTSVGTWNFMLQVTVLHWGSG